MEQSSSVVQHQPFSSLCCAKNFSLISCTNTMAKRMQEQKEEERIVAKSTSTAMNLSSTVPASSSSAQDPIASKSPGVLIATGNPESRLRRNSKSDGASSSQARLQDAYLGELMDAATEKPVATKEDSGDVDLFESETWSLDEEELTEKPVAEKEWSHNLHGSPATVHHSEAVFSIVRNIYGREHDDPMDDLDVNILDIYLNTTLQAAVHLEHDHEANLRYLKNHLWKSVGQLFNETGKLISEQNEITGIRTTDFQDATWMSTGLLCEKACRFTNAKTYVFSDSMLWVEKWEMDPIATWKSKNKWYSKIIHFKDMNKWKTFSRITTLGLLEKIQSLMRDLQCEPEHFNDRTIFMPMYNDIAWQEKGKQRKMWIQFTDSCELCSQTPSRSLVFLGAWIRREICTEHDGKFLRFGSSNISCLQCLWKRENYEAKEAARSLYTSLVAMKTSSCFSARWFLRTCSLSTEPKQIYATNYPKVFGFRRNLMHVIIWKRWRFLQAFLVQKLLPLHSSKETWCKNTSENSNSCQKTRSYPNYALVRAWSLSKEDNTSSHFRQKKCRRCNIYAENEDGFSRTWESAQSWTWKFVIMKTNTLLKF